MTLGSRISGTWNKFCYDMIEGESFARLPLPGEYFVAQLCPSSLLSKMNNPDAPKLTDALLNFPYKRYCVMVYKYLTTVSFEENWWHTCLLLILCSTGGSESTVDTEHVLNKTSSSPPPNCEWIVIPARFVTRFSPTPRAVADVCRISSEALEEVFSKAIASQHEGGIVLCKGEKSDNEHSSKTWTADAESSSDPGSDSEDNDELHEFKNASAASKKHWLLWPHFKFDLDAHQPVSSGTHFLAEQSTILRLLDDHWVDVPQLTGLVAKAQDSHYCSPQPGLSIEGIRYRHHYMKDKESHIVIITAGRMDSRRFNAVLISDYTMSTSKKLRNFVNTLTSGHRPRTSREKKMEFIDFSLQSALGL